MGECFDQDDLSFAQSRFVKLVRQLTDKETVKGRDKRVYVIASPLNLLGELFTTRGSGTMFRHGAKMLDIKEFEELDIIIGAGRFSPVWPDCLISPNSGSRMRPAVRVLRVIFGSICARQCRHFSGALAWVIPLMIGICAIATACRSAGIGACFGWDLPHLKCPARF